MILGLVGYSGHMGQTVLNLAKKDKAFSQEVVAWDRKKGSFSRDIIPDVVIDFSLPASLEALVPWIQKNKTPWVSGVTGYDDAQLGLLKSLKVGPLFWASNMSLGIYYMRKSLELLATWPDVDVSLVDIHHKRKIDAPSGTALTLKESVLKSNSSLDVQISSQRVGEVIGVHELGFFNGFEQITIKHEALSRDLFAQGALNISKWIVNKESRFYEMEDYFQEVSHK